METSENPSIYYIEEFPILTWVCMRNMIKQDGGTGNFQDDSSIIQPTRSYPTYFLHPQREVKSPEDNTWAFCWLSEPMTLVKLSPQGLRDKKSIV